MPKSVRHMFADAVAQHAIHAAGSQRVEAVDGTEPGTRRFIAAIVGDDGVERRRTVAELTADASELEIYIYGRIGGYWWDYGGCSASSIAEILAQNPKVGLIKLRVNSLGGSVFEGAAIYNQLLRHPARKECDIDGVAASAASWIVLCADVRRIGLNGLYMIHETQGETWGPADEHEKTALLLRKMNEQQIDVYATRSSLERDDIAAKVAEETWFTAAEALAAGFVTEVATTTALDTPPSTATAQSYGFRHAPVAQLGQFFTFAAAEPPKPPAQLPLIAAEAKPPKPAAAAATNATAPGKRPSANGEKKMNHKLIAKALGISESADEEAFETAIVAKCAEAGAERGARESVEARLTKLEAITGKSGDETIGVLLAWKQSHEELPGKVAELAQVRADGEERDLTAALQKAKDEKRHTPAREEKVRALLKSEDVKPSGALAMIGEWGVVAALAATAQPASAAGTIKIEGKTFDQLTGEELAALRRDDPQLYAQLRNAGRNRAALALQTISPLPTDKEERQ